ncbi:DUF4105 domain-containing protein [uncultured Bacteroides sp.]|uniref:lipoprotein N-acyltransferase Lnb n=1 Tax=uncultured Bacteroides sp. TaxID=162156 RepID=UPI002AAC0D6A|nr:DUF4105 domain-containing protein [uncultured Bacteroides sp.]
MIKKMKIGCRALSVKYALFIVCICFIYPFQLKAASEDSVRISLLTCSPGSEIYALFGHTALRYENKQSGMDVVFNYGMFDFNAPHFIWRYIKGETDYQLGVTDYFYFEKEYANRNSSVYQQTLNLLPQEKESLFNILKNNYLPENRVYRYNFFFDNCSTRPRDRIEECIKGKIKYTENNSSLSFRDIVHQFTASNKWAEFGIDLCLGSKADEIADYRFKMFAPYFLKEALKGAKIKTNDGKERTLLSDAKEIVASSAEKKEAESSYPSPLLTAWSLFAVVLLITIYGYKKQKIFWGIDIILFSMAGFAGCIIAFLVCFSQHPTVSPNYMLFVFHPLHLLYLPLMVWKARKKSKDPYQLANLAVLTFFMVFFYLLPQKINFAVVPLALCLWIRSMNYVFLTYKRNK